MMVLRFSIFSSGAGWFCSAERHGIHTILVECFIGNIGLILFEIWTSSSSGGDVV